MKTFSKLLLLTLFLGLLVVASSASAGEVGEVSCATPACGYKETLNIGGTMRTPAITVYCPADKKFIRIKLKSHADYHKPPTSSDCPGPVEPIRSGNQIARIPCPKCGNMTLQYKLMLKKD
jgi:predicted RNA-binding Zn-ribbon protein involved in translation (DUF1610 family)